MSVDERLRSALRDQAEAFVPPVETALDRVRARGGRWRAVTIALTASAAAAVAVVGVWAVAEMTGEDAIPTTVPTAPASPTGAAEDDGSPLRGSIRADVAEPAALAGAWTLTLNGNGTMDVTPPPGFVGDVSGALSTADSTSFRSTLFGSDLCSGDGTGIVRLAPGRRPDRVPRPVRHLRRPQSVLRRYLLVGVNRSGSWH